MNTRSTTWLSLAAMTLVAMGGLTAADVPPDASNCLAIQGQAGPIPTHVDRDAILAAAATGFIHLQLGACSVALEVTKAEPVTNFFYTNDTATVAATDMEGEYVFIYASVVGHARAVAFLVTAPEGVGGIIHLENLTVNLEVPRLSDPDAPHMISLVEILPAQPLPSAGGFTALAATQHASRYDVDYTLYSSSGGPSHVVNVLGRALFENNGRTAFDVINWGINYCTTSACDDTTLGIPTGTPSISTVLSNYGAKMKIRHNNGETWELAGLFLGRDVTGGVGLAYISGRYAAWEMRDGGTHYDGRTSTYEGALTVAHEIMHNFKAPHDTFHYNSVPVMKTVCDLEVPVLGICLLSHQEVDYYRYYYGLMYGSSRHEPALNDYQDFSMPSSTISTVNNCESGTSWTDNGWDPTGYAC